MTTNETTLAMPENDAKAVAMTAAAVELATRATTMTITSVEQNASARALQAEVKLRSRELDDTRKAMVAPALEAQRRINAYFNPQIERLDGAVKMLTQAIGRFEMEQARLAQIERDRVERERRAAEAKADEERRAAEKLALEAQKALETAPDDDFAAQILAEKNAVAANELVSEANARVVEVVSAPMPAYVAPPRSAKVETATGRTVNVNVKPVLKIRIVDPAKVPRAYCEPVQAKLNAALKLDPKIQIDGCEVYEEFQSTNR